MNIVGMWERFLDSLDTPGGHILVLLTLLGVGIVAGVNDLMIAAMGALFAVLRTTQSNHARQNGKEPTP